MSRIMASIVLILAVSVLVLPVGIGYTRAEYDTAPIVPAFRTPGNTNLCDRWEFMELPLEVAAGELIIYENWSINPSKYYSEYSYGMARAGTTIYNRDSEDAEFDLGDGTRVVIPAYGNLTHTYKVELQGETVRFHITKIAAMTIGINIEEVLNLKIVPKKKGGDVR